MTWLQNYDPIGSPWLSTLVAAFPVIVLLGAIASGRVKIHHAAVIGLAAASVVALFVYKMPVAAWAGAGVYGALFGLFPIGWIILNVLFLYQLTVKAGLFAVLRDSLARVAPDPRVQLILIAFCFGAFIEGVAGFGAPVAITGAILIQLRFNPVTASCLALIANTAPVAFGSLGIPITTLEQVTGLDALKVSKMVGRQLPFFSLIIPFWVVGALAGWRGMLAVWPAALTAGLAFSIPQFLVSNFHGPWLVDTIAGACSIGAVVLLCRFWKPTDGWKLPSDPSTPAPQPTGSPAVSGTTASVFKAWMPWLILTAFLLAWGTPAVKSRLDAVYNGKIAMPGLHNAVQRTPPVSPANPKPEAAEFKLNIPSATGTGLLCASIVAGFAMGFRPAALFKTYLETIWQIRFSLITVAGMLALGNITKYGGIDATLGLALAGTGSLYPFFGALLGWLGVALTGSDTASNVLFGSLQKITSEQLGLSPILMGAANSSGGVMGKMIDAQSIVVASTATRCFGQEGAILRRVFWHSLVLASLVGVLVYLQAYVPPFTEMVVK